MFELSFAGVVFPLDGPEARRVIDERVALDELQESIALPDWPVWPSVRLQGAGLPNYGWRPRPRLGTFFYPSGATRWAEFHGLATTTQKDLMVAAVLSASAQPVPGSFVVRADADAGDALAQGGISTQLYLLPPRPLTVVDGGLDGLWLITLVDERWYWQYRSAGIVHPSAGTTWAALFAQLASALTITLDVGTIDSVYGVPSEDSPLWSNHENAAGLLDAVAWNVGKLVVRNLDGSYTLQTPASARVVLAGQRGALLLGGGDPLAADAGPVSRPAQAILPARVTVSFPRFVVNQSWVDTRDSRDRVVPSHGDVYVKEVTLADAGYAQYQGHAGSKVLHDSARAYYNDAGDLTPINQSELDNLAVRLARDCYDAQLAGVDETYPGIRAWTPEGLSDILWVYRGDACYTRVQRKPWNFGVSEYQHEFTGTGPGTNPPPGTVTSVGLELPASVFTVAGSPVTTSGTLSGTFNEQAANRFFAAPVSVAGVPVFRTVVPADLGTGTADGSTFLRGDGAWAVVPDLYPNADVKQDGTLVVSTATVLDFKDLRVDNPSSGVADVYLDLPGIAGGRLTTESGVPVSADNRISQQTIYYTRHIHDKIALYDGTRWKKHTFAELSLALTILTVNKNYDVFVWNDSGTLRLQLSSAWTNDTTRGDALIRQNGVWVNQFSIGPMSARRGTHVGIIRISVFNPFNNTSFTEDAEGQRFVVNRYHRLARRVFLAPGAVDNDAVSSYSFSSLTWAEASGGTSTAAYLASGEDLACFHLHGLAEAAAGETIYLGIGDNTTASAFAEQRAAQTEGLLRASLSLFKQAPEGYRTVALLARVSGGTGTIYADDVHGGGSTDPLTTYLEGWIMG